MSLIEFVEKLRNQKLKHLYRNGDVLILGFGDEHFVKDKNDKICKACMFRLYIHCTWRVVRVAKKEILFAKEDIYKPIQDDINEFDWETIGESLFDEKSNKWFKEEQDVYIREVQVTEFCDIKLYFSNGDILESFLDISLDVECWSCFYGYGAKEYKGITVKGKTNFNNYKEDWSNETINCTQKNILELYK